MNTTIKITLIALSSLLMASCKGKKQPTEAPAPSISVTTPEVKDITLCCVMMEQPCIQVRPREMCEESG